MKLTEENMDFEMFGEKIWLLDDSVIIKREEETEIMSKEEFRKEYGDIDFAFLFGDLHFRYPESPKFYKTITYIIDKTFDLFENPPELKKELEDVELCENLFLVGEGEEREIKTRGELISLIIGEVGRKKGEPMDKIGEVIINTTGWIEEKQFIKMFDKFSTLELFMQVRDIRKQRVSHKYLTSLYSFHPQKGRMAFAIFKEGVIELEKRLELGDFKREKWYENEFEKRFERIEKEIETRIE